jgi:hypothetical protein
LSKVTHDGQAECLPVVVDARPFAISIPRKFIFSGDQKRRNTLS